MRVIIAGGRDYKPDQKAREWLVNKLIELEATEVVSGCCKGADAFGETIARLMFLPVKHFPADWNKYGRKAGPLRNQQMAEYADACILFPGGYGTEDMRHKAASRGIIVIKY